MSEVARWIERSSHRSGVEARLPAEFDFDHLISTVAICGSPAEAIERMATAREMLHLDTHLLMMDLGGLPESELFEVIDLVGDDLIEHVNAW